MIRSLNILLFFAIIISSCSHAIPDPQSPDGRIAVKLGVKGDQAFSYSILKEGKMLVRPSDIALKFSNQADFGGGLDIEKVSETSVDESWKPLWGKTSLARNHYNEYVFRLSEKEQGAGACNGSSGYMMTVWLSVMHFRRIVDLGNSG